MQRKTTLTFFRHVRGNAVYKQHPREHLVAPRVMYGKRSLTKLTHLLTGCSNDKRILQHSQEEVYLEPFRHKWWSVLGERNTEATRKGIGEKDKVCWMFYIGRVYSCCCFFFSRARALIFHIHSHVQQALSRGREGLHATGGAGTAKRWSLRRRAYLGFENTLCGEEATVMLARARPIK